MRKTKLRSVRGRLILLFLSAILIALIALLVVIALNIGNILNIELQKEMDSALAQAAMHIEFIEEELQSLAINIGSDTTIQKVYSQGDTAYKSYLCKNTIREVLNSYMYTTNYILGIDVIYDDGTTFSTDQTQSEGTFIAADTDWAQNFIQSEENIGFSNVINITYQRYAYQTIAFAMKFNNYYVSQQKYTTVMIYIRPEYLTATLTEGLQNANSVEIINNGEILYQKKGGERNGEKYTISKEMEFGLTIQAEYSSGIAIERYGAVFLLALLIALAVVIVMCAVAVHSIRRWTKPISDLKTLTSEVAKGNFDVAAPAITDDEMGELTSSFVQMTQDLKKYIDQQLKAEQQRNELQMELQMAKINPHFIYNTLDSVIWLALMGKKEETADLCRVFVNILQDTLHIEGVDALSTLKQELALVRDYEKIQKIRYGNRFQIVYEVEESTLNALLPKLTLQPLVENALFHGILPQDSEIGTISIRAWRNGETLILETEDDGVGLSEQMREKLSGADAADTKAQMHSIGLSNIRKRLELLYPNAYKMYFDDQKTKGTKIVIEIQEGRMYHEEQD